MPGVEVAHGRRQTDAQAFLLPLRYLPTQVGQLVEDPHQAP
jgi:hypothetical protein